MTSNGQDRPRPLASEIVDALARSAYPTGNVIRRALLTLRDEGLRSFWFKLLGECGYRRLLLLERPLDQPIADYTPDLPVDVTMLAQDEVDDYLVFRPGTTRREIVGRLRSGGMCFVARHQGRIAIAAGARRLHHHRLVRPQRGATGRGMGRGAAGLGAVSRMPDRCDAG